ncbi:MAG TPA: hypothetical protein VEJ43_03070 [Pseudolabrys sp.]|nr:hypothetical protein [Pseudolabrys sp.]
MSVRLRSIPDTQAAVGWADGHTIVIDRPDGKAGGIGLGFNGGQLLGLAVGGCATTCNISRQMIWASVSPLSRSTWRSTLKEIQ